MTTGRRLIKNFLSLSGSDVIARLLGSVLTIYIARVLGAGVFGQLSFAIAFTSYFTLFSDFGLTTLGVREIAKDKKKTSTFGTNILVLQLLLAFLLILVLSALLIFLPLSFRTKIITFLFGLGIIPGALNMAYIFQAYEEMEYMAVGKIIAQIGYVIVGFIFIYLFKDILVLPIVSLIAGLIGAAVIFYLLKKKIKFIWSKISWRQIKKLIERAYPFLIAALAVQIYYNMDSIMLQFMKGEVIVGLYNAAYKIVLLIISIGGFIAGTFFPLLSSAFKRDKKLFFKSINMWSRINGALIIPIVAGGILLARPILNLLYGQEFVKATFAFQILILLPGIIFLSSVLVNPLLAIGQEKKNTIATSIGALVNIIGNFLLIPRFSLNGAAVATLIAEVVVFSYLAFCFHKYLKINVVYKNYFSKPVLASLVMGGVLYLIRDHLPVLCSIIIGGLLYISTMFLIKGVTKRDLKILRTVQR